MTRDGESEVNPRPVCIAHPHPRALPVPGVKCSLWSRSFTRQLDGVKNEDFRFVPSDGVTRSNTFACAKVSSRS